MLKEVCPLFHARGHTSPKGYLLRLHLVQAIQPT